MKRPVTVFAIFVFALALIVAASGSDPDTIVARINFQPAGEPDVVDYERDEGDTYSATRGFGWSHKLYARAAHRHADARYDSNVFEKNKYPADWEYDLPNGTYYVTLVVGDPQRSAENNVAIEGVTVFDNVDTDESFAEVIDHPVTVSDGKLTMTVGGPNNRRKTRVCYLIICDAPGGGGGPPPPPPPPPGTPPTATPSADVTDGDAPLTVVFGGAGTDDGTIASYAWDFGDGANSNEQNPTHTYTDAGAYTATLTVTDDEGLTGSDSLIINVNAPPPPPAGGPGSVVAQVNFQPSSAVVPNGYAVDDGSTYSSTRLYGWSKSIDSSAAHRHSDPRYDTDCYIKNNTSTEWNHDIANGQYFVTLVCGNPRRSGDHYVRLEGDLVLDGVDTDESFVEVTDHLVTVNDGQLTMRIGDGGNRRKTRVCFIIIRSAAPPDVGLTQRVVVQGLNFPVDPTEPVDLDAVNAFPNLSFNRPVFVTAAGDGSDRIFVVEQEGKIHVFPNNSAVASTTVFLDISGPVSRSSNEEGLLGLAFHPDYETNGYFYVYYSMSSPRRSRLSRFEVSAGDADVADAGSETVLLEFDQPEWNHNGGTLAFGPDGKLYVSSGDGGDRENAQDTTNVLGAILRLNDDGTIPGDNPLTGASDRKEIWAYGLRNPWRMSFDRTTGDLWAGDVGQSVQEEIDLILEGANYGWGIYEGTYEYSNPTNEPFSNFEAPIVTYGNGDAVIGGYVYRGTAMASMVGSYLYGDYGNGRVWALVYAGGQVVSNTQVAEVDQLSSFGEDEAGELYACSLNGRIYRFQEAGTQAPATIPTLLSSTGLFTDTPNLVVAPGVIEYRPNAELWSDGATKRRWIALPGTSQITFDATGAWTFPLGTVLVKHFEIDLFAGGTKRLETRALVLTTEGWEGYTYKWNADQLDATLLEDSATEIVTVPDGAGGSLDLTWSYPSRADCMSCHTAASGRVLGVRTRQLNGDFPYPNKTDNQLRSWNHIGLFTTDIGDHDQYEALADPFDATAPLEERARSYLAVNCAQCHLPLGPTPVDIDFRYGVALADMNLVGVAPTTELSNIAGSLRIDPASPSTSVVYELMGRLDEGRMPPLGSNRVHAGGRTLIEDWITDGPN